MKAKILNGLMVVVSLLGYMEWGGNNHAFLFQAEAEMFSRLFHSPESIVHPFIILPLFGQIALLFTVFQHRPKKWLTITGISGLAIILWFVLLAGILSGNILMVLSTLPFTILAFYSIAHLKQTHRMAG
ncbi:MAG TPA: hypothetical protein PKY29_02840 [Ferruginibacter sp.]|nr:hypothetical protein [Ferruginibacter sp.]HRO16848.1 hypothetical protein [Ferruginibacter sp.]HRQ20220.1 hypothetical protein [Ferruginibacter sp.]